MTLSPDDLQRHAPFLRRLARALMRDEARAEDLVQDTFVAALERPPAGDVAPRAWLARAARGLASRTRRSEARRAAREALAAGPVTAEEGLAAAGAVLAAVRALAEPYRATVWQRYFEERPPRAIARRAGLSVRTVESRLRRAREELRRRLAADGGDPRAARALAALAGLERPAAAGTVLAVAAGLALPGLAVTALWLWPTGDATAPELPPSAAASAPRPAGTALAGPLAAPATPGGAQRTTPERPGAAGATRAVAEAPTRPSAPFLFTGSVDTPAGDLWLAVFDAPGGDPVGEPLVTRQLGRDRSWSVTLPPPASPSAGPAAPSRPSIGAVPQRAVAVLVGHGIPPETIELEPCAGRKVSAWLQLDDPGAVLDGVAVDRYGDPIVCANVTVVRADCDARPRWTIGSHRLTFAGGRFLRLQERVGTEPGGRFRAAGLDPGPHRTMVEPQDPRWGGMTTFVAPAERWPAVELPASRVTLAPHLEALRIEVRGPDGPLDGVFVSRGPRAALGARQRGEEVAADLGAVDDSPLAWDGRVRLLWDRGSEECLLFSRPGYGALLFAPTEAVLDGRGVATVVLLPTTDPTALRLTVLGDGDEALPARLAVELFPVLAPGERFRAPLQRAVEPGQGLVLLPDVPPGTYELVVRPLEPSGYGETSTTVEVGPHGESAAQVVLPAGGAAER